MHDKVCQKRLRCAPPFFDNLEKNGSGVLNNNNTQQGEG